MKPHAPGCSTHKAPSDQWMQRLRARAGRVTQSRREVLVALEQLRRPSTPREIAAAMVKRTCDLATIYRSMSLFECLGLVHRIDLGDGLARFELADDDKGGHHHHHLLCRACGRIVRLDSCILAEVESALARHYGYAEVKHRLEFFGVCPDCQQARTRASSGGRTRKR